MSGEVITPFPKITASFSVAQQKAILRAAVRHAWVKYHPKICFALMMPNRFFTHEVLRRAACALRDAGWNAKAANLDFAAIRAVKGGAS